MLKRFDHIVKNALKDLRTSHVPDWELFHELLRVEEQGATSDESLDEITGDVLRSLEYTTIIPAWDAFETRLDGLNADLDAEFDQSIRDELEGLSDTAWTPGAWSTMSTRLDELNAEMDAEFDQTVGSVLGGLPEATWKEQHWQMLSNRLDRLNDRPRILLMKVVEVAAIILLLVQLTNLYTGLQQNRGPENNLTTYLENIFKSDDETQSPDGSGIGMGIEQLAPDEDGLSLDISTQSGDVSSESNPAQSPVLDRATEIRSQVFDAYAEQGAPHNLDRTLGEILTLVSPLTTDQEITIPYNYLKEVEERLMFSNHFQLLENDPTPQLTNDPQLIAYSYEAQDLKRSSPRLDVLDINLLHANTTDSVLNSIPTIQVIKPRIHSSMEVGVLADATNVEIQDYVSLSGSYNESTLSPGAYFRYKIQYQNIFGSLGGDYLKIRYNGLANDNEVTMVSLPLELGYNFVNLPSFRMYFSGGIAGRFVPVANYSTENFNQASTYVRKSQKPSNGLLKDGPFEINSYLSGRMSVGLDINVNKKTSINLRFSHDLWLKGGGIGYNLDKFRSNHLAIGTNFHF